MEAKLDKERRDNAIQQTWQGLATGLGLTQAVMSSAESKHRKLRGRRTVLEEILKQLRPPRPQQPTATAQAGCAIQHVQAAHSSMAGVLTELAAGRAGVGGGGGVAGPSPSPSPPLPPAADEAPAHARKSGAASGTANDGGAPHLAARSKWVAAAAAPVPEPEAAVKPKQCVPVAATSRLGPIDWARLPPSLHMLHNATTRGKQSKRGKRKGDSARLERKQRQCEAFADAVAALGLPDGAVVVDFGCGSCGLTLPLAYTFPRLHWVGVDIKPRAIELMAERAREAGLQNLTVHCGSIERYEAPFGCAISLHACGPASDAAIERAVHNEAPYLVAPCCVGKVKFSLSTPGVAAGARRGHAGVDSIAGYLEHGVVKPGGAETALEAMTYPRSAWLAAQLRDTVAAATAGTALTAEPEQRAACDMVYGGLISGADSSTSWALAAETSAAAAATAESRVAEVGPMSDDAYHRAAATVVGLDRNEWARETSGYSVRLCTMPGLATSAKSDVLVGWPGSRKKRRIEDAEPRESNSNRTQPM